MKIKYDPEVDAIYIDIIEEKKSVKTIHLSEDIALDFSGNEELVGIEILDASKVIGLERKGKLVLERLEAVAV
ncbi:MAG: hypothetical protein A2X61_07260 [Ignavibacteria bacterium GWB2_35_12]|nr:MAG: hypothetical protein A2X63_08495 [Ignavibacteria bacterium GWA2_35_8]OGU39276.1 MAG: hypothetical protein A2X61_07260 [Ignavibacteria bacterium GWB2_35_12]OGU89472.1 MAG: hypothetical protein A2220_11005 [Ignavibacteria bacterium RIFOXYA2_FULL_35_10]OGV21158.1 MAG: hypothetical protein A2475_01360 [Ignavibacteria bacterium RIFOXYC2_FULL_35_21]